jgi:cytochrome c biogenesis protein CcmG/thiol:disulfide interchange protein DsbE
MRKILLLLTATVLGITLATGCAKSSHEDTAPDFQLKSLDGPTITLSDLRGQPVLLNFWATWCGPCRFEMPFFQQLSGDPEWQARDLQILAVNIQESEATVSRFMVENGLSFTVLLDTAGEAARLYNVSAIPATYIIDKDGIIINNRVGAFTSKVQIEQMILNSIAED